MNDGLFFGWRCRLKRKGATPPNRAERVVRDLQSGFLGLATSNHPNGTKHRRRKQDLSSSSQEHIANLMSSPTLHIRAAKVTSRAHSAQLNSRCVY